MKKDFKLVPVAENRRNFGIVKFNNEIMEPTNLDYYFARLWKEQEKGFNEFSDEN